MKNLKEAMKNIHKITYTQNDIDDNISRSILYSGNTHCLVITIEEIGELINVISENVVEKTDYLHTVEEITDVILSLEYCKQIAHIKDFELETEITISVKKHRMMTYIKILSETQQSITKFIRRATKSRQRLIQSMIKIYSIIDELIEFYSIDLIDIEKMKQLKINRMRDRLDNNETNFV